MTGNRKWSYRDIRISVSLRGGWTLSKPTPNSGGGNNDHSDQKLAKRTKSTKRIKSVTTQKRRQQSAGNKQERKMSLFVLNCGGVRELCVS